MSEEQRANRAEVSLPTKTKIAVWWLSLMGMALIIFHFIVVSMVWAFPLDSGPTGKPVNPLLFLLIGSIFYFASGFLLSKRSKRFWIITVSILSLISICSIGIYIYVAIDDALHAFGMFLISAFMYLTPLILIILDRKNYFEMVHQRELEKKVANKECSHG